jgi:23S rRNA (uridine2552-2'-O)-methyltransferase
MTQSKSSKRWLREHFNDPYVKLAQQQGLRSRAVFKLQQIQKRDRFIKLGMTVVDLGAAPGGWATFVKECVGSSGRVIASDILPMDSIAGVEFIQGDFADPHILNQLLELIGKDQVDLVVSDMAPNMSGMAEVDQPRFMYLAELALDFAKQVLCPGGSFLIKVFQGAGFTEFISALRQDFKHVQARKPAASRQRSAEVYLLARVKK